MLTILKKLTIFTFRSHIPPDRLFHFSSWKSVGLFTGEIFLKNLLIEALEREIIVLRDDILSPKINMLVEEYEQALKEAGWDPEQKIKITKRGEYKISSPFQCCLNERIKVLKRVYDYYYHNIDITLEECFDKAMERFDKLVNGNARSTESAKNYRSNFNRFVRKYAIAQKPIRQIKASALHEHLEDIAMEQELSVAGLRDARTVLYKAFAYAYNNDIITNNVMDGLSTGDIVTKEINNDERVYTEEERDKLLKVMTDETVLSQYRKSSLAYVAARALCLAFCAPLRNGEIRSLKWEDVDFTEGDESIFIHSQIRRFTDNNGRQKYIYGTKTKAKKRKGNRTPALCDFAVAILKKQRENSLEDAVYIFESNGKPLAENTLNQWLKRFCNIAGIEYLPSHSIRFYAVTTMNAYGIDKARIQHTAGHCCVSTTEHYIRNERANELTKTEANMVYGYAI